MRKRRGRLARLVTVFLALLVALALTGMGYGIWSDTVSIEGTMVTGTVSYILTATGNSTDPEGGSVTCQVVGDPAKLKVTVINAVFNVNYYGAYRIKNTGEIPLKMLVDTPLPLGGVGADIIDMSGDGVIDPEETESGKVRVWLKVNSTPPVGKTFFVITNVVPWNQ